MAEAAYDPFEEFNRAQAGMGRVRNPYTRLAELRRTFRVGEATRLPSSWRSRAAAPWRCRSAAGR